MAISRRDGAIHLTGALRHADAAALAAEITANDSQTDIRISDSGVTEIAFGVLQVLLSADVTARARVGRLHLDLPGSSILPDAAARLGLSLPATPAH